MNVKIIVATHKPYWMPDSPLYLPVLSGSNNNPAVPGFQPDNVGENISCKNNSYCELTALYWAWRNLDATHVGLAHYRRHFKGDGPRNVMSERQIEDLLSSYDVVMPKRRKYYIESVRDHYLHAHHAEPLELAEHIIQRDYPEMLQAWSAVMDRSWLRLYNMFVMSRQLLDAYCSWLFPILFEIESKVDMTGWNAYEQRALGFLAERLFNVWVEAQGLRVVEVPVVSLEGNNWPKKAVGFVKRKIQGKAY